MRVLKKILVVFLVFAALIAAGGFLLPSSAHVERSIVISVPREAVFPLINEMKHFNEWSPWAELDPKTEYTFEGPAAGVGSKMSWKSQDPNVGAGRQEIVESQAPSLVKTDLNFEGAPPAKAIFQLDAEGSGTKLTWAFEAEFGMNILGRYFGLMFDSMIGPDYEKGLAKLKKVAEAQSQPASPPVSPTPEAAPPS